MQQNTQDFLTPYTVHTPYTEHNCAGCENIYDAGCRAAEYTKLSDVLHTHAQYIVA